MWLPQVWSTQITYEQANLLNEIFAGNSDVKVRVIGSSESRDYNMSGTRYRGVEDIVEFINVMYLVYDADTNE